VKIKFVLFICLYFSAFSTLLAQQYKYVYYFDKELNSCKQSKSAITGKGYLDNGYFKLDYFSNETSNLLLSVHYTDSTLNLMQGLFQSYYQGTLLEKEGNYVKDEKHGVWQQWNEKGQKTDSSIYDNGVRTVHATFSYHKNGALSYFDITDSLQNTLQGGAFSEKGVLNYEKRFIGEIGILKYYDSSGVRIDSVFTREEIEASYPGGDAAWKLYLQRNLNVNIPITNGAPAGYHTVIIKFVVAKDGSLKDIVAETFRGYGMELEVIRIIKKSARWNPAKQYGRYVNAYRRQPITFSVESK
jgi:antitoxin component YwqK of YwqJK toxin-antitoxin module